MDRPQCLFHSFTMFRNKGVFFDEMQIFIKIYTRNHTKIINSKYTTASFRLCETCIAIVSNKYSENRLIIVKMCSQKPSAHINLSFSLNNIHTFRESWFTYDQIAIFVRLSLSTKTCLNHKYKISLSYIFMCLIMRQQQLFIKRHTRRMNSGRPLLTTRLRITPMFDCKYVADR